MTFFAAPVNPIHYFILTKRPVAKLFSGRANINPDGGSGGSGGFGLVQIDRQDRFAIVDLQLPLVVEGQRKAFQILDISITLVRTVTPGFVGYSNSRFTTVFLSV